MSKIICDICGTMYPDTAQQCPICGSPRKPESRQAEEKKPEKKRRAAPAEAAPEKKAHVRGGRFSKANVRKRNAAKQPPRQAQPKAPGKKKQKSNKGLVILLVILLLAILAVGGWLFWKFGLPMLDLSKPTEPTAPSTEAPSTEPSTEPPERPCTGVTLQDSVIELTAAGRAWLMEVRTEPADTTDPVIFGSSDESVVTVTEQGRVTAVGPGQAIVTVTCGGVTQQCRVMCDFEVETEPTEPAEPDVTEPDETAEPTEKPTEPDENITLKLNKSDISFLKKGETYTFSAKGLSNSQITWSSANSAIVTIENGKATAVAPGTTKIIAKYKDQEAECIIRCKFPGTTPTEPKPTEPTKPTETEPTEPSGGTPVIDQNIQLRTKDVTISVGETFRASLINEKGDVLNVTWTSGDTKVCTCSGLIVTGVSKGTTRVTCTYNGESYSCIVRVK